MARRSLVNQDPLLCRFFRRKIWAFLIETGSRLAAPGPHVLVQNAVVRGPVARGLHRVELLGSMKAALSVGVQPTFNLRSRPILGSSKTLNSELRLPPEDLKRPEVHPN